MEVKLITRANKFGGTSKYGMERCCEKYAAENDVEFIGLEKSYKWAYQAGFVSEDLGEFWGVMIAVPTGKNDCPVESDILFGPGQMVGSRGDYIIEADEYYGKLGIGD